MHKPTTNSSQSLQYFQTWHLCLLGIIFIISQNQITLEISEGFKVLIPRGKLVLDPRGEFYGCRKSCRELWVPVLDHTSRASISPRYSECTLKAGHGEQLQVTLFGKWLYGLTTFFFSTVNKLQKKKLAMKTKIHSFQFPRSLRTHMNSSSPKLNMIKPVRMNFKSPT